jgi:carbamoyl-phosphate synthase large subunit
VPFVAKATGVPVAKIAARLMAGEKLASFPAARAARNGHVAVKEAVFPFNRFPGVDTVLGPEMRSTGEVMGLDWRRPGETMAPAFARAFAKSQLGGGVILPTSGALFVSVKDADKPWIVEPVKILIGAGFSVLATGGTCDYLAGQGIKVERVKKVLEGRPHIVDAMKNGEVQLVFNTTEGKQSLADSFELRRTALMGKIPYFTTTAGALAAALAIVAEGDLEVRPLQSYA